MADLIVTLTAEASDDTVISLAGFPFHADQCVDEEIANEDETTTLVIGLGDNDDTTAGQEQFLNTSRYVAEYRVVKSYFVDQLQVRMKKLTNTYPTRWEEQRGYIVTTEGRNIVGGHETEGIDYAVLDDDHIAMREAGDNRPNADWVIVSPDEFAQAVIEDAERWATPDEDVEFDFSYEDEGTY